MIRPAGSRARSARSGAFARMALLLASCGSSASHPALAQDAKLSDWPCPQVLVRKISLPAVWSGPPIRDVKWRQDPARIELVARLAARRMPIEEARRSIEDFTAKAGTTKNAELVALFAGLFETLDAERTEVIDGLVRFGRKQRELAETIKTEQAALRGGNKAPAEAADGVSATARLEWNLRIFEERRQALASVCESPALVEQRLFALARTIEQNLD